MRGEGTLSTDLDHPTSSLSSLKGVREMFQVRAEQRTQPEIWSSIPSAVSFQTKDLPQQWKREKEREGK